MGWTEISKHILAQEEKRQPYFWHGAQTVIEQTFLAHVAF